MLPSESEFEVYLLPSPPYIACPGIDHPQMASAVWQRVARVSSPALAELIAEDALRRAGSFGAAIVPVAALGGPAS
jgi:hypothetical protein